MAVHDLSQNALLMDALSASFGTPIDLTALAPQVTHFSDVETRSDSISRAYSKVTFTYVPTCIAIQDTWCKPR